MWKKGISLRYFCRTFYPLFNYYSIARSNYSLLSPLIFYIRFRCFRLPPLHATILPRFLTPFLPLPLRLPRSILYSTDARLGRGMRIPLLPLPIPRSVPRVFHTLGIITLLLQSLALPPTPRRLACAR